MLTETFHADIFVLLFAIPNAVTIHIFSFIWRNRTLACPKNWFTFDKSPIRSLVAVSSNLLPQGKMQISSYSAISILCTYYRHGGSQVLHSVKVLRFLRLNYSERKCVHRASSPKIEGRRYCSWKGKPEYGWPKFFPPDMLCSTVLLDVKRDTDTSAKIYHVYTLFIPHCFCLLAIIMQCYDCQGEKCCCVVWLQLKTAPKSLSSESVASVVL